MILREKEKMKKKLKGNMKVKKNGKRGKGNVCFDERREEIEGWRKNMEKNGIEIEEDLDWKNGENQIYLRDK